MNPRAKKRSNQHINHGRASQKDLEYIADMLNSLKTITNRSGDSMLYYLIEIAETYTIEITNTQSDKEL